MCLGYKTDFSDWVTIIVNPSALLILHLTYIQGSQHECPCMTVEFFGEGFWDATPIIL